LYGDLFVKPSRLLTSSVSDGRLLRPIHSEDPRGARPFGANRASEERSSLSVTIAIANARAPHSLNRQRFALLTARRAARHA
jgi:hypothetical protein